MDRRDIEQIDRFLAIVGKASLFEYYGVDPDADTAAVEEAIKKKRTWAQGQQANPKYRSESLWIIKNMALAKKAMVEEKDDYLKEVRSKDASRNLEVLTLFIKGALADGHLTPKKEDAIRHQAKELGLPPEVVTQRIDECLAELGAKRVVEDEPSEEVPLVDYYKALEVERHVSQDELEKAYRAKYRWARNLRDVKKASEVYAQLDEAWRILKDPEKRAAYNQRLEAAQPQGGPRSTPGVPEAPPRSPSVDMTPPPDPVASTAPRPDEPKIGERSIDIISGAPPARPPPRSLDASLPVGGGASRTIGFQDGTLPVQPSGDMPPVRQAPRPPEKIGGRTLGLGAQQAGTRTTQKSPRLQLDGPEVHRVVAWRSPEKVRFTVRNAGTGAMSGRVFSDRDWVQVSPARLDPEAQRQTIEITVHPKNMPRSKAVSLVTVVADHGERKVVTIETQRQVLPAGIKKVIAGGVLALALLIALVGSFLAGGGEEETEQGGPPTRLIVTVDPPAGQIYIGGRLASEKGRLDIQQGFPVGTPFEVRVVYWGFKTVTKTIQVRKGSVGEANIQLELDPAQTWVPPQNAIPGQIPRDEVARVFTGFITSLSRCLAEANIPPGKVYKLTAEGAVRPEGQVYAVELTRVSPEFTDGADAEPCLLRDLRALPFAPLDKDAYATFTYDFSLTSPERSP